MTARNGLEGRLTFLAEDQERFAEFSGDRNPMHVDPTTARRLLTGRLVVHGVHAALQVLERARLAPAGAQWWLDIDFVNPLSVGDDVTLRDAGQETGAGAPAPCDVKVLETDGLRTLRLALWHDVPPPELSDVAALAAVDVEDLTAAQALSEPLARDAASWVGTRQRLRLPRRSPRHDFPHACDGFGESRIAAMALLSTYVGMVCPGMHSVFSSVRLAAGGDDASPTLDFEVRRHDARFGHFVVAFGAGPIRGELRAFSRPPPRLQMSTVELRASVRHGCLGGRRHWVIGGSRGLGELSAKAVAAAGGDVLLTYFQGADDAAAVVADISTAGAGSAEAVQLSLSQDFDAWMAGRPVPDVVWYFATPRIFRKRARTLNAEVLLEFLDVYAVRFAAFCEALERHVGSRKLTVVLPSTVAVTDRPLGMTEYAMAKAAAEVLSQDLSKALPVLRFVTPRLPRLETDQTATIGRQVAASSNLDTILDMLSQAEPFFEAGASDQRA